MEKVSRWKVELLLSKSAELHQEGRYAESLRAAEQALEAAVKLGDLGLEIKATRMQADRLTMLGDKGVALARYSRILGFAFDPARRAELERANVSWEIAYAYLQSANAARFLPEVPAEKALSVLDQGEAYVRGLGRPGWRAGLLWVRAQVLWALGKQEQALGVAEEGLALKQHDGSGPGVTLASHRWGLGDMLLQVGRVEEARVQYQAVLDVATSHPNDRMVAWQGLASCALESSDAPQAHRLAKEAVRLAEGMGDNALQPALGVLIRACRAQGDLAGARGAAERMLAGARRIGSSYRLYFALRDAADVALDARDVAHARALLDEAQPHAEAIDRSRGTRELREELQRYRDRLLELGTSRGSGGEGEDLASPRERE